MAIWRTVIQFSLEDSVLKFEVFGPTLNGTDGKDTFRK